MTTSQRIKQWNKERGLLNKQFNLSNETFMILEEIFELNGYEVESHDRFKKWLYPFLKAFIFVAKLFGIINDSKKVNSEVPYNEIIDALCDIQVFSTGAIYKLGYDNDMCMDETLKEIESRVGKLDSVTGKFMKDKSAEARVNWYKANYERCDSEIQ